MKGLARKRVCTSVTMVRGKGGGGGGGGQRGGNGVGRDFVWGDGHMMLCAGDVLLSRTLETRIVW